LDQLPSSGARRCEETSANVTCVTMNNENVRALSVRDLVRRRCGDDSDVWHLALVQRAEVWDHVRMRYLLDSLLAGYPIGSLLVCQVNGQSRMMQTGDRVVADADRGSWQLLDGQQRINALFSLFTPGSSYGRFYLHMTARREPAAGPLTTRRAREDSLQYIHWKQNVSEAAAAVPDRDHCIDLSRWYTWAEADEKGAEEAARTLEGDPAATVDVLNAIDPEFADRLEPADTEVAWHRLRRLLDIWRKPMIPVEYLTLGSPLDVLEVFTRINRAGVQVAGQDLFFAAVKTLWNEAEQTIARVVEQLAPSGGGFKLPIVTRLGALRVLARLAARAVGQTDLVPLGVERLTGARGEAVIEGMRTLSDLQSSAVRRMATMLDVVMCSSKLGFGLYSVDERLWDDVLAWAAVNRRVEDKAWVLEQLPSIDGYLIGATSFRYPSVLRERFSRLAMTEALAAGLSEEGFPTRRIAEVTKSLIPDLRDGRQGVRGSSDADNRLWLADNNAELFLSVLQAIPYRPQLNVFDWDHIFPAAKAGLMWSPGPDGRWRRHHQYRRFVRSAGNFWGLDAGANRAAKDLLPQGKFENIATWSGDGTRPVWPRDRWWLTDVEIEEFGEIGLLLDAGDDIDPAMDRFHSLVRGRALRMTDEVFRRLPEAELFAADQGVAGAEPSPVPVVANALGIERHEVQAQSAPDMISLADERVEQVLRLADDYGSGTILRELVARTRQLGLQVRGYTLTLNITPPSTKGIALIALTPQERGLVTTSVEPCAFVKHFPSVTPERFDKELGGIRELPLDRRQIQALADRLEELLRPQVPEVCTVGGELDS